MQNQKQIYIYPTDTVWGIGCSIFSEDGYTDIAKIKQTKFDKPLSILFPNRKVLEEYFDLTAILNTKEAYEIFKFGVTLLIPKKFLKKEMPEYLVKLSDFISVRMIDNEITNQIYNQIHAPFFTTSLNLTSEPPITNEVDAVKFHQQYCVDAKFVSSKNNVSLSGVSSTIIKLESNKAQLIRVGEQSEAIKNYLLALNLL